MILLLVSITLSLLRNNLYQSLNFILSLSNHPGSGTMLLSTLVCLLLFYIGTDAVNILSVYSIILSEALFMICKDSSHSNNASIPLS